ncbi:MAG: recombinase family protein, partial [Eubacteriales bacterium]|nr:recombinase family protein [Eubacteriales bacterium]
MARKSRKNVPVNVSVPSGNLTSQAVMELDKETKPYQVAVYARLSHESEANRERDTVETQISYIKNYVAEQPDMVVVDIYADVSVSGTTFERPEFERMMQDIRAGRVNTVITRDLSRLGRNYVESGNYIERVFPFLDVRFIAITDDFDTARPGTDLSMPLKNIVNEYYSKDLSEKVSTGKRAIWLKGEFCEFLVPYGYRKENKHLVVNEETRENVVHIFEWFLEGRGYNEIARMLEEGGNLSPQKYRLMESGKEEAAQKAKGWTGDRVKKILGEEYYIGNSVH